MIELWRLFRAERHDPAPFYRRLATDVIRDLERHHGSLRGRRVADLGSGPGYYSAAFVDAGADVVAVEGDLHELNREVVPGGAIVGDAAALPLRTRDFDGVFCSNMLEHTPDPARVVDEMVRVVRPGGWAYLSFTNWYSPWGGHEMSPYHLLGPRLGPRLYERRHGPDHKHRVGENLFPVHIGETLRIIRSRDDIDVDAIEPRYWPWARVIMRVPGVREMLAWNCVVRFRARPAPANGGFVA
jgi:SAM-dependent methyltransferase